MASHAPLVSFTHPAVRRSRAARLFTWPLTAWLPDVIRGLSGNAHIVGQFAQMSHIQIFPVAPLVAGYITETGTYQH